MSTILRGVLGGHTMLKPSLTKLPIQKSVDVSERYVPPSEHASSRNSWATTTGTDGVSDEETFFDAPTAPETRQRQEDSRQCINESIDDLDDTDSNWEKSSPPAELFIIPPDTSLEIESIIETSIEALQKRLEEERSTRAELRRQEERRTQEICSNNKGKGVEHNTGLQDGQYSPNLARNAEGNPNPYGADAPAISVNGNWNLFGIKPLKTKPRLSGASDGTIDSGYGSGTADTRSIDVQPPKASGLRGLFRRSKQESTGKAASTSDSGTMKECVSCLDDFEPNLVVNVGCHDYCKDCFQTLIANAMGTEEQWPPKCCLNEIPSDIILPHLDVKKRKKYNSLLAERLVPAGERLYCSKASCAAWIPPKDIDRSQSCASCPSCRTKSCTSCRGKYHYSGECPTDPALLATMQLAADEGWRRCYSCSAMVEHNQGCMHMTCKCKASFCYVCGSKWRTCSCGLEPPAAYLAGIQARRAAASARESAREQVAEQARAAERIAEEEADELREMLQAIEEFETMEAVRLASEDEVRRLEEEADRALLEEKQIESVMKRFRELNDELEFVHDMQRVALISVHEEQLLSLDRETRTLEARKQAHANELQGARTETKAKISEAEFWFDVEYQERVTKQRAIEIDYFDKLTDYWWDKEDGQLKIEEGKCKLRESHAKAYAEWYAVRTADHEETVRRLQESYEQVKNEISIQEAAMDEMRASKEAELRRAAETNDRWMEMVAAERFKMLQTMEQVEYSSIGH